MAQLPISEVQHYERRPVTEIRKNNIRNILVSLRKGKTLSRQELCEKCELTGAGLSRNIHKLINAGLLIEEPESIILGRLGRRRSCLSINPNGAYVFGITIAHNRKSVALVNAIGTVIVEHELTELDLTKPLMALATIIQSIEDILTEKKLNINRILGASVMLGISDGSVVISGNKVTSTLLEWADVPVVDLIQSKIKIPVCTVSRAGALIQVEIEKLARPAFGQKKYLLINCGLGLGTAFQIIGGASRDDISPQVQISHVSIEGNNAICDCGKRGCLEQTGAGAGVVRCLERIDQNKRLNFHSANVSLEKALAAANAGDLEVSNIFYDVGKRFAVGIDTACSVLLPDHIFIAGEVGRQKDYVKGIFAGLKEINSALTNEEISICDTRSSQASGVFALNEFLFSDDLNLYDLELLDKRAS